MKNQDTQKYLVIVVLAMFAVGAGMYFILGGGKASTTDDTIVVDGEEVGPWANKLVKYELITSDKYTGADVASSVKVYDEQPEEWLNARGDFNKAAEYTAYSAVSGVISIDKEMPGVYYVVLTASGYNTDFLTITIPDGIGRGDISEYQGNPDSAAAEMTAVGTTTAEHLEFTLTNQTAVTEKANALETVDAETEFRGWKVIVNDVEGFSTDTDGDGKYDEGIIKYTVTVGTQTVKVFDPANGVDLFDSNDEYTFMLKDVVADKEDLIIKVEVKADTSDSIAANDEKWGEGEGTLSTIKIYDAAGDIFASVNVVA